MRVTICSNLQRDVHVQNWLLVCLDINGVTNRPDEILDAFVLHLVSSFRKPERLARGKWIVFCSLFQLAGRSILAVLTELHMENGLFGRMEDQFVAESDSLANRPLDRR